MNPLRENAAHLHEYLFPKEPMIKTIDGFLKGLPEEFEKSIDPEFMRWLIKNLAIISMAQDGSSKITGFDGSLTSEMTPQGHKEIIDRRTAEIKKRWNLTGA